MIQLGLGFGRESREEKARKRGWWRSGGGEIEVVIPMAAAASVAAAMSLALSSARASQKALWVMKLSFLQKKIWTIK